ncbi:uncharacterized protein LOC132747434 isoform X5 [Ruditapes philippinarum]|uniref:uncharacterized protein LOC132747434 isoform X5 n=1 Tax=Ruditapes philippinarum TaxID=129788 RepID=UPI00295B22F9|nr:uncharacterized protein LOC132747434 isoform X5 [Ruditapes philippinarum]
MQDVLVECISFILFQRQLISDLLLNWLFYCVTGHLEESQLKSCSSWQKDLACFCIYSTFLVIGKDSVIRRGCGGLILPMTLFRSTWSTMTLNMTLTHKGERMIAVI